VSTIACSVSSSSFVLDMRLKVPRFALDQFKARSRGHGFTRPRIQLIARSQLYATWFPDSSSTAITFHGKCDNLGGSWPLRWCIQKTIK
jgi:hypothetical protein